MQGQLGHASIRLPFDTYGRWIPMGNKAAVDRLDDAAPAQSGSKFCFSAGRALQNQLSYLEPGRELNPRPTD